MITAGYREKFALKISASYFDWVEFCDFGGECPSLTLGGDSHRCAADQGNVLHRCETSHFDALFQLAVDLSRI
jgi:hypothetical protein